MVMVNFFIGCLSWTVVMLTCSPSIDAVGSERVTYNPYKGSNFVLCGTGDPVLASTSAALVVHNKKGFIYV